MLEFGYWLLFGHCILELGYLFPVRPRRYLLDVTDTGCAAFPQGDFVTLPVYIPAGEPLPLAALRRSLAYGGKY
jgi:hypothetical protein